MIIGGFQKTSLIDYPDRICSIIFTAGCNFRCPFCHNKSLVDPRDFGTPLDTEEIINLLEKRRHLVDAVTITGGEPTIHSDLPNLVRRLNAMGFLVKLDTQGSKPRQLAEVVHMLSYVAFDIKTSPEKYDKVDPLNLGFSPIRQSIKLVKNQGVDHEFRTTCVPTIVEGEDVRKIAEEIPKTSKYYLQNFVVSDGLLEEDFKTLTPYSHEELESFKQIASAVLDNVFIRYDS